MPLYDFNCAECKTPFEKLVRKEADIATTTCPNCTSAKVEKLISLPAKPGHAAPVAAGACGQGPPCGAPWCQRQG
jgi:putative FmdB family regulatory protein